YTVSFTLQGMQTVTRQALVQLSQDTSIGAQMSVQGLAESVTVTAEASYIDRSSAELKSGVTNQQIMSLPVGQEYRDLIKLIPGVMYTQDTVRGPSAGGSGQDNVYQFDGANVTLPLFGTLASEPASHDIAQITTIKGGARAIDFDRAGGFSVDSVSKSGTNRFTGMLGYQVQTSGMAAELKNDTPSRFEQDRTWLNVSAGGPVLPSKLFFYGSYYRPTQARDNAANAYGELPDFESTRNEGFGKLTYAPTGSMLFNASYRDSKRENQGDTFGAFSAASIGTIDENRQRIANVEGSWVINARSHATFKYSYFGLETLNGPANISSASPSEAVGTMLAINALDQQGLLDVPQILAGQDAYNAFVQPIVSTYGYLNSSGVRTGGGLTGFASQNNDQDFFRNNMQAGYNLTLGTDMTHDLHVGYQRYTDKEELRRSSNGWGSLSVPGGRLAAINGQRAFYTARFQRLTEGVLPVINSEYTSHNVEINDTIRFGNWTFNAGLLASYDILYGQGLREDSSTLSGFTADPLNKYEMYTLPFDKMLQPRLSATWAYNGHDTLFASFAVYKPAASSLPRAASWDRALTGLFVDAHFDANGRLFAAVPVGSSSGKLFQDDLTPRSTDEYTIGTARQINDTWSVRLYGRYRDSRHFWEDTNNTARVAFDPPAGIPREPYIADLTAKLAQIGSGSTYVIAELDGAYTKYQEVALESEWRGDRTFLRGSYAWSRYYGNMDQDNSTFGNDAAIFIGSSNIADGAGRQLWDFKDGTLRGDRPHQLKLYGYYQMPWDGTIGAYAIAQSGQPWETWSYEPYRTLTSNTSDTIRYAEKAGSNRTDAHYQMDLNYTQNFRFASRYTLQLVGDLFNALDNQTGYNIQPGVHSAGFGTARSFYDPRRFQIAARLLF
ncbi:MAG: carboxypeptidase regulatory-like domain-containing protein, partial [Acidobacteriota bacterium]|nr:carboxypeptidase regulatory-like domain-containing protein [Acidobacteriota bacterium]